MNYNFKFKALAPYTSEIIDGVILTLQLSAVTMLLGLVIGLAVAIASISPNNALRTPARIAALTEKWLGSELPDLPAL